MLLSWVVVLLHALVASWRHLLLVRLHPRLAWALLVEPWLAQLPLQPVSLLLEVVPWQQVA